ncbi:MAG: hypothetical protein WCT14_14200 [Treponemataceae bacterium]
MTSVTLPATKAKDAYAIFFDDVFLEGAFGKTAFVNPHPQSKYKLGGLSGLMLHAMKDKQLVLSGSVPKSPDALVSLTFFVEASGCRIVAETINLPEGGAGEKQRKTIETLLAAYASRFGGKVAAMKKSTKGK